MGNVRFELDAESGKAVQAFLRVVDAQKKTEDGMRKIVRAGEGLEKIGNSLRNWVSGLGSAVTVGQMVGAAGADIEKAARASIAFEDAMTGLLSLENNLASSGAIKNRVLTLSNVLGMDPKEVASAMFDLQSGTANLAAVQRDDLFRSGVMLNKVTGEGLPTSLKVLTKTYQIYRNELRDVTDAQNKVFYTAEQGYMTFGEMAGFLPEVLSGAKAMGNSVDEAMGALIVATQYGGKTETTFTGVRNVFLRMNEAVKEGIPLTGSLAEKLQTLSKLPPDMLKKIFGDEAIATIKNLTDHIDEVHQRVGELQRLSPNVDIVARKLALRETDPGYMNARTLKQIQQTSASADVIKGQYPWLANEVEEFKIRQLGAEINTPPWMAWFKGPSTWYEHVASKIDDRGVNGTTAEHLNVGLQKLIADSMAAGDTAQAGYYRLRYGRITGAQVGNESVPMMKSHRVSKGKDAWGNDIYEDVLFQDGAQTRPVFSGKSDAMDFLRMRAGEYPKLTDQSYLKYRQLLSQGNTGQANDVLFRASGLSDPRASVRSALESGNEAARSAFGWLANGPSFTKLLGIEKQEAAAEKQVSAAEKMNAAVDRLEGAINRNLAGGRLGLPTTRPADRNAHIE